MRTIEFDSHQDIPLIDALFVGPRGSRRLKLAFDTGCATTQIDTGLVETAGYSVANATEIISIHGPAGDAQEGYLLRISSLKLFGKQFDDVEVGVYDFDNFAQYGIDGLLGWNVIKQFHLEMDGPGGVLKIY